MICVETRTTELGQASVIVVIESGNIKKTKNYVTIF
jgi:hypothetical protein